MAYISAMPKSPNTIRKEVHLMPDVIKELQAIADKERRSLKNLLEKVLIDFVNEAKKKK